MPRLYFLLLVAIACVQAQDPTCVDGEIDLVFILDASNSIGQGNFRKLKEFLDDFTSQSSVDDGAVRIGAVSFSTSVETEFFLNTYLNSSSAIRKHFKQDLKYLAGATNTAGALSRARNALFQKDKGDREDVDNFVIIITDGQSNIDSADTIPFAQNLKDDGVIIFGIGIGREVESDPAEIRGIVSAPADDFMMMLDDYNSLLTLKDKIFTKICPIIEEVTVIKDGSPCPRNGEVIKKRCKVFKCIDSKWKKIGFTGCNAKGRCIPWGEEREYECNKFQCFKGAECADGVCSDFDYRLVNAGCMVDGKCIDENSYVDDQASCTRRQCIRREDGVEVYGEYVMVEKECMGPDGLCRPIGFEYQERCVTYQCTPSDFMGIMDASFVPVNTACQYGEGCVPLGEIVNEVCDELICSYDDASMGYDMMLVSQGCEYNGKCLKNNEKVFEESTCTNFVCAYSKKQNRLVIKERIAGCKGDDGCTMKGDTVGKGCIKYECDSDGNLVLKEAGCEVDGKCYPVGESWRLEGECAVYRCVMGESTNSMVETDIEKDLECHDFNGNCLKPGQSFVEHCNKFQCKADGKLDRVDAKCEFDGQCYEIGKDWIDNKRCKHVFCKADNAVGAVLQRRNYGCKDENGKCFAPGEYYTEEGSCVKNRCFDDHVFRREECDYKGQCYEFGVEWTDLGDCISLSCNKDDYSGEPVVAAIPYGCIEEGVCMPPGETFVKDCQTYKCMPNGQGFKIIDSQCPWKQNCKSLNQTWFDKKTCRRYGCYLDDDGDVDIVETTYGCRDADNNCFNDKKDLVQDQCITYDCDNGNLIPTKIGCETEDGCMQLDEVKIDDTKCIKYKCVMSDSGNGFIATKIKEVRGCLDHDKCYFPGATKVEDCSTYVCTNDGTFRLEDPQCEFNGECIPLNSKWENEEKCKKFKCVISKKTGLPVVRSFVWGCRGKNKCHKFGAKRRLRKCVVNECQKTPEGPKFVPVKIGCPKGRTCKPLDSTWINKDLCVKETCGYEEGNKFPDIFASPYGCFDEFGNCHPYGAVIKDNDNECIKYECTVYGTFTPISAGCPWKDKCRKAGTVWRDLKTCTKYRCKAEYVTPTKVLMHTIQIPGCLDLNGKCLNDGDTKRYDCTDYQCDPSRGGLVIIAEACTNGEKCEPVNSTWTDPSSCITYQCLYDPALKDLFITEKQYGCSDEVGQCYNKGQKKENQCNKFVCNAKGDFQVIKAGCEKDGKCYGVDESWQEGCVSYSCAMIGKGPNYVETKIFEYHGCVGNDGVCYKIGDKFKDGCIEYTCEKGGEFRMQNFGCVGFDGECVMPGQTVTNNCNQYQCDSFSLAMQPVVLACNDDGKCRNIDDKWFDKDDCLGYKCQYNPETNAVDIVERISGCKMGDECLKTGSRVSGKDCVEFQCKNGQMIPTQIGCEYKGKCLEVNEVVEEECAWTKCIIAEQGPTFIDTKLVTEYGCWDCYHQCHRVGEEFTQGCKITECLPGGFTNTIMHKCMTPDGYCIEFGEQYNYDKNGEQKSFTCSAIGDLEPITIEQKCMHDGKSYREGEMVEINCIVYRCVGSQAGVQFSEQQKQCMTEDGQCYAVGKSWTEGENTYRCTNERGVLKIILQ